MIVNADMQRVIFDDAVVFTDQLLLVETTVHGSGNFGFRIEDRKTNTFLMVAVSESEARLLWQWINQQIINRENHIPA